MTTPADVDLVERVLRESGVDRELPPPAWSAWLYDVAHRLAEALSGAFPVLRKLGGLSGLLGPIATAVLGAGVALVLLLVVRTALEDRTLQAELAGYADYARQVRYRLLPRVW